MLIAKDGKTSAKDFSFVLPNKPSRKNKLFSLKELVAPLSGRGFGLEVDLISTTDFLI